MATYSRKVTELIDALQWTGDTTAMNTFMISVTGSLDVRWSFTADTDHTEFMIKAYIKPDGTETGEQPVNNNDYVVWDSGKGQLYPLDQTTFESLYQAAP